MKFKILIFLSFLLLVSPAFSLDGKIYSLKVSPEVKVLETNTITIEVENVGDDYKEFKLRFFITKDGILKHQTYFNFDLYPGKLTTFLTSYTPDDIGEFEALAKLYDKYETELYDTKTTTFKSISDVGPFDISIEILSSAVKPKDELPISLNIGNKGVKGKEVRIVTNILCKDQNQKDFTKFDNTNLRAYRNFARKIGDF